MAFSQFKATNKRRLKGAKDRRIPVRLRHEVGVSWSNHRKVLPGHRRERSGPQRPLHLVTALDEDTRESRFAGASREEFVDLVNEFGTGRRDGEQRCRSSYPQVTAAG